jgi:hypothetical protein
MVSQMAFTARVNARTRNDGAVSVGSTCDRCSLEWRARRTSPLYAPQATHTVAAQACDDLLWRPPVRRVLPLLVPGLLGPPADFKVPLLSLTSCASRRHVARDRLQTCQHHVDLRLPSFCQVGNDDPVKQRVVDQLSQDAVPGAPRSLPDICRIACPSVSMRPSGASRPHAALPS